MKVQIEKVANGFVVTEPDGTVHVATEISPYSYSTNGLSTVLQEVFKKKEKAPAETGVDAEVVA